MAFSKSFPKSVKGKNFPEWVDVYLSEKEERFIEEEVRQKNIVIMKQCLNDAKSVLSSENMEFEESDIIRVARTMFEKLASHTVYAKERRCKDKFDRDQRKSNATRENE